MESGGDVIFQAPSGPGPGPGGGLCDYIDSPIPMVLGFGGLGNRDLGIGYWGQDLSMKTDGARQGQIYYITI